METDIRHSEPSSPAFDHEMAASAEQWANWTTDQIRSAVEAERERTFGLLTELLVQIQKDVIPEVVATLPALRGPVGGRACRQAVGCQGVDARNRLLRRLRRHVRWRQLSSASRHWRAA